MSTRPQPERRSRGADHASLEGARVAFRVRSPRVLAKEFRANLSCDCVVEGRNYHGLRVHDLSANGLSIELDEALIPGTRLESLSLLVEGNPAWHGAGEVVYVAPRGAARVGCRLVGEYLDLERLRFRSDEVAASMVPALDEIEVAEELPATWRALVTQWVRVFAMTRRALDRAEETYPDWRDQKTSRALCESVHETVMPRAHEIARRLVMQADRFDDATRRIAADFSIPLVQEELRHGEFMRRAYEKPLGYAGDYRMMELLQMEELAGDTLYGRYLSYSAQENPMGISVRRRAELVRSSMIDACATGRPMRVLSLACGPGMELRQFVRDIETLSAPLEVVLVDQDEEALRACQQALLQTIADRSDELPVTVTAIHFSLRQLVFPRTQAERGLIEQVVSGVDFLYSMGLFDYLPQPIARRAVNSLYRYLSPQGRMLIGNLQRVPESIWPMEFGADWFLVYRDHQAMLDLASSIDAEPASMDIVRGAGHCLFLEVARD